MVIDIENRIRKTKVRAERLPDTFIAVTEIHDRSLPFHRAGRILLLEFQFCRSTDHAFALHSTNFHWFQLSQLFPMPLHRCTGVRKSNAHALPKIRPTTNNRLFTTICAHLANEEPVRVGMFLDAQHFADTATIEEGSLPLYRIYFSCMRSDGIRYCLWISLRKCNEIREPIK